jgi:hypothetical protein
MCGAVTPLPNMSTCRGAQLNHRDNFAFLTNREEVAVGCQSFKEEACISNIKKNCFYLQENTTHLNMNTINQGNLFPGQDLN